MIDTDFSHIPGVGPKLEKNIRSLGISSWSELLQNSFKNKLSNKVLESIQTSIEALNKKDTNYFAENMNKSEFYKIVKTFPKDTIFLDIETTGLSLYYDSITIIGYSKNGNYNVFINDHSQSSEKLIQDINSAKAIVTYNGTMFDLKFIQKLFPDVIFPKAHLDLRFFAKRFNLTGGQKSIEQEIGFSRKTEIKSLLGDAAPILWHQYRRGDKNSLKKLIEYNQADIKGMKFMLDYILEKNLNVKSDFYKKNDDKVLFNKENIIIPDPDLESLKPLVTYDILNNKKPLDNFCVIGIDLVSSETRESGICALKGKNSQTCRMKTDKEMIKYAKEHNADLISIDSPLSIPVGRTSFFDDDPFRQQFGITRHCERILKRRGINSYPCLIPSMQRLTKRGMELTQKFRKEGIDVIESYPGAAQDVLNIPRKQAGLQYLTEGLAEFGLKGDFITKEISHDELDAITSALVGHFYQADMYEGLGNEQEDYLIIPKID